jgi:hypothetical protein
MVLALLLRPPPPPTAAAAAEQQLLPLLEQLSSATGLPPCLSTRQGPAITHLDLPWQLRWPDSARTPAAPTTTSSSCCLRPFSKGVYRHHVLCQCTLKVGLQFAQLEGSNLSVVRNLGLCCREALLALLADEFRQACRHNTQGWGRGVNKTRPQHVTP